MSKEKTLRVPPQSLDSERAVLGSIMLRPGSLIDIGDKLSPEAFYAEKHKKIFETMLELSSRNEPIDLLSLSHTLTEKKTLETVGGSRYLMELSNAVPSSTNVEYYAKIVEEKYLLRRLIGAADKLAELGYEGGQKELEEILDTAEKEIFSVTNNQKGAKYISIKDGLEEAWTRFANLNDNKGMLRGVSTGFKALDDKLSGFQNSDLIILAARPSVGKTALALDMARRTATMHNNAVAIFSLEMSQQQLVDRMFASQSQVDSWRLRTGKLSDNSDYARLQESLAVLSKAPIYIDDQSSSSIVHIRSIARRMKAEHDIKLIIIDYLQLMTTTKNYDSMVNQVTEISRSLKSLARELNVPVIALSQLSRAAAQAAQSGEEPKLHHLRDSGSIEQDADVVMFIHREEEKDERGIFRKAQSTKVIIAKHRNGPVGTIELNFNEDKGVFLEIDNTHAEQPGNDVFASF